MPKVNERGPYSLRVGVGIGLSLVALVGVVAVGSESPANASAQAAPSSSVPALAAALSRPETQDEGRVAAAIGATTVRGVGREAGRNIFAGVFGTQALCVAVENPATGRVTGTCGNEADLAAGRLFIAVGGNVEDGAFTAGLVGSSATKVDLTSGTAVVSALATGGVYSARTEAPVDSITVSDAAGKSTTATLR